MAKPKASDEIWQRFQQTSNAYSRNYQRVMFLFYLAVVVVFTIFSYSNEQPHSYFGNKRNILNVYFVKLGWAWTLFVLILYLSYGHYKLSVSSISGNLRVSQRLINALVRIGLASVYWFVLSSGPSLLNILSSHLPFGRCGDPAILEKEVCLTNNLQWFHFDISGHCFLLIHSSLVLLEEIRLSRITLNFPSAFSRAQTIDLVEMLLLGLVSLILFLWVWMLIVTCMYFHTTGEKALGAVFGFLYWSVAYAHVYNSKHMMPTNI